jgi:hypothetical protein
MHNEHDQAVIQLLRLHSEGKLDELRRQHDDMDRKEKTMAGPRIPDEAELTQLKAQLDRKSLALEAVKIGREKVRHRSLNLYYQQQIEKMKHESEQLSTKLEDAEIESETVNAALEDVRMALDTLRESQHNWHTLLRRKPNPTAEDPIDFFLHFSNKWRNLSKRYSKNTLPLCRECKHFERPRNTAEGEAEMDELSRRNLDTILQCHQCLSQYHAGCLDPPLTKIHQRGFVWQCEACDKAESNEEENDIVSPALTERRSRRRSHAQTENDADDDEKDERRRSRRPRRIKQFEE